MAISERDRHLLQQTLDELMDPHVADTLMQHLPPGGWANMATKHDLDELEGRLTNRFETLLVRELGSLRSELHAEIGALRTETHTEIGSLRHDLHTEISSLRHDLHTEIGGLRHDLHTEIGGLRSELHSELHSMARTYVLGNIALVFTVAAVAFGAARLV